MKSSSGYWTEDERRQFEEGVIAFGWGNWVQISKRIPSRSKNQLKSHAQKFSIHRKTEYAVLLQKHEAAKRENINCGEKKKKTAVEKAAGAVSTPMKRNVRRSSRSSTKRDAATKSAAPTPVKVRRASKSSIATIDSGATVTPKLGHAKAQKPSKKTVKKPKKLGAQLMKFFTKSDTSKGSRLCADQLSSTDNDSDIMEYDISKKGFADKTEVQVEFKNSKVGDEHEMRRKSNPSFASLVTPNASMKSTVEEAQELMASLDYLDDLEDVPNRIEEDSFALALADDIFDIKLDEDDITIPDVVDIAEGNSVARSPKQISSDALMHLRLQVQPNEGALDEITAFLQSHPDSHNVDSKRTLMRRRIINLVTEASNVGWWRESENLIPELVRKAHLEHLVALTFAVLQADEWKRSSSEDNVPLQTQFNAQDEIRHICQLLSGIWNRVNHFLARDSYALFGAGVDQLERSHAVKGMVLMFDEILLQTE